STEALLGVPLLLRLLDQNCLVWLIWNQAQEFEILFTQWKITMGKIGRDENHITGLNFVRDTVYYNQRFALQDVLFMFNLIGVERHGTASANRKFPHGKIGGFLFGDQDNFRYSFTNR